MIPTTSWLLALMLAFAAAPARAAEYVGPGAGWARSVAARSPVPGPAGPPITVVRGSCPDYSPDVAAGCAKPDAVYATTRRTLMHELGHEFDWRNLDGAERFVLAPLLGPPGVAWGDCGVVNVGALGGGGYGECPLERVADAYASCALDHLARGQGIGTGYGWVASYRRWRYVCHLLWRFADPAPFGL